MSNGTITAEKNPTSGNYGVKDSYLHSKAINSQKMAGSSEFYRRVDNLENRTDNRQSGPRTGISGMILDVGMHFHRMVTTVNYN